MSTWVGLTVNGLEIEGFQNGYSSWFFKNSDRVRETFPRDDEGNVSEKEFIGYRASAASIRRRMVLEGYDIEACRTHFLEYREQIVLQLEPALRLSNSSATEPDSEESPVSKCWKYYLAAVRDSNLEDWIALLPEAFILKQQQSGAGYHHFTDPPLSIVSPEPLINAMLCHFNLFSTYVLTGPMNFPCNDSNHFVTAFLASCSDDAIFELNIEALIRSGYSEDFTDLEEIHQQETQPHIYSRESIEESQILSATQPENISLQRMCYASIITAMEAYMSDILRREILGRPVVKERFVANYPAFNDRKLKLSDIFTRLAKLDSEIRNEIDGLSLHKIDAAKNIFSSTLLTEFSEASLPFLGAAVKRRHHIVHRNGRNTDGELLLIGYDDVAELAEKVLQFNREIDLQILDGMHQDIDADRD